MSDPTNNNNPTTPDAPSDANTTPAAGQANGDVHPPMAEAGAEPFIADPDALAAADQQTPVEAAGDEQAVAGPGVQIAELQGQLAEERERYVRAMAEMENVRRRAAEDVSKAHKFSIEQFAEALIPVKDSLEMALKVESPTVESLNEGVQATLRQLGGAFARNQLMEIDPLGQKFDPNQHQAISMMPASDTNPPVEPNHVATVLQKGYLINDRVLRPALVVVAEA